MSLEFTANSKEIWTVKVSIVNGLMPLKHVEFTLHKLRLTVTVNQPQGQGTTLGHVRLAWIGQMYGSFIYI